MNDDLPPFGEDIQRLFDAERQRPGPSLEVRAQLAARLEAALGSAGLDGIAGAPTDGAAERSLAATASAKPWEVVGSTRRVGGLAWPYAVAAISAALIAGTVSGVWVGRYLLPVQPSPAPLEPFPSPSAAAALVDAAPSESHGGEAPAAPLPRESLVERERSPGRALTPSAPQREGVSGKGDRNARERRAPTAGGLAAERLLIDAARTALARGDGNAALDALRQHEARYSDGVLLEERAAMVVQALAATGQVREARASAADFKRRHPRSLLLPAVDQAVRAAQ